MRRLWLQRGDSITEDMGVVAGEVAVVVALDEVVMVAAVKVLYARILMYSKILTSRSSPLVIPQSPTI